MGYSDSGALYRGSVPDIRNDRMPFGKKFDAADYTRMANELEAMAELILRHPEKNHNTSARLKALVSEMRADARAARVGFAHSHKD